MALSFAGAQRPYVERVAATLKARGLRVFYDADEQTDLWGRYLTEELPDIYAEQAAAVVVFVSAEYAVRDWTQVERRSALNRAVRERREYVLPASFDDTQIPGLLSDLVAIDLRVRPPEVFADLIVEKLDRLDIARPPGASPAGVGVSPVGFPGVWNVPTRLATFTGREDLLGEVAVGLAGGDRVAVAGVAALHGLGGVGKTQLATEYAHRHVADYDVVWWVNAEQTALVGEQVAALAASLGLPVSGVIPEDAAGVYAALGRRARWLLVFDNAETAEQIQPWLPDTRTGHVLITSRSPVWGGLATRVSVDILQRAETVELLSRRIPGLDEATADGLAEELGDLPLAVAQAAGYLEQTGGTAADYLARFRTRRTAMVGKGRDLAYGGTVDTAWSLTLDQLATHHPAAADLLTLAAYLAPEPIPLDLFTDHPDLLPAPLATTITDSSSTTDFEDVLGVILGYALGRRTDNTLQVHRLLQAVVHAHHTREEATQATDTVGGLLAAHRPGDPRDSESWVRWAALGPHLLRVTADLGTHDPYRLRHALDSFCYHIYARGDHPAAHTLAAHHHQQTAHTLGEDHPDTLGAAHTHVTILGAVGELQAARILAEDTLTRRRRVLGDDHPSTLASASNLARQLADLGDHQAARTLDEDTLTRFRRVLGNDHPETLTSGNNLTLDLADLGDHQAARVLAEDTLTRFRRVLGDDHPSALGSASNLALELAALGDHQAARTLDEDTLTRRRRVLGDDHPDTLSSASNLANRLAALGDPQAARTLAEDTLTRRRRILGEDHPDTLTSANNLAATLAALGDHQAARRLDEGTLTRRRRVLGDDHPDTLNSANNLANRLAALGDPQAARTLAEDTLTRYRRVLGDDHPNT